MEETVFMKCGHAANAETYVNGKKVPCCAICNCIEVEEHKPDLTGRMARCVDCGRREPSDWYLPFFEYRKDKDEDEYYCGCYGWD